MHLFRVPYLLDGPWYATWLTSAVGLFAMFAYGMWLGTVNQRWGLVGTLAFLAVQAFVVVAGLAAVAFDHGHVWSAVGGLTALGVTGLLAILTVLFLAGGQAAVRRATV